MAVSTSDFEALAAEYLQPTYARFPVEFVRGEGWTLWDVDGNDYLDFLSGISVTNLGHSNPVIVAAVIEQAARLMHTGNLYYTRPALELAQRLSESSLGGKVYFANSGAEANEAAIKLARKWRRAGELVVLEGAFHGRTYGALSATPQEAKQAPFAPLVPGFVTVPKDPDALAAAVSDTTAAVMLEPIQGESGVHELSDELLRAAREACDRTGALLIYDEIQCGMGRTGTLWAYEQTGIKPDLMTVAKALANGLPIGALITTPQLGDVFVPGDHGSTFAGGPVVCATALAVLSLLDDPLVLSKVADAGSRLRYVLRDLPRVTEVRGRGLMVAVDVDGDAPALVRRALFEERLIVNATGPATIRFLPPLVITPEQVDDALGRLHRVLESA